MTLKPSGTDGRHKPNEWRWHRRTRLRHAGDGGRFDAALDAAGAAESNGLVWSKSRRITTQKHETRPLRGGSHAGRSRGNVFLARQIFPENPASRQAESSRFRRRGRAACDHGTPLPAGL